MCSGQPSSSGNEREILPANVKPINYNLTIVPALETFKYSGQASISLSVLEPSKTISANVKEVTVSNVYVTVLQCKGVDMSLWPKDAKTGRPSIQASNITYNKEFQTVTFEFDYEIPAGSNIMLHLDFEGIHNDQMAGFYRSGYTDSKGEKKYLAITQFESTDARRCFPCWDEPNLKATFDVTLIVPKYTTALSNMNVIEETDLVIGDKTLNCVKFATTPIMSTYLLAFCVGEFEYAEAVATPIKPVGAKPIVCRTYTLKGQKEQGKFALGVCTKTLEFFSEYFDVAYPLPKMDMIAIPDFGAGAMENWGLVTYRESAMLFDPAKSSVAGKQRVAYVVGHELAHQWFGNLVTMDWWNELWLNEGFATFVGWLAVDHIFPEWEIFVAFLLDDYENGVELDCLRSSHPIEVDVKSPTEVEQIFDAISYSKGSAVIRMLNAYLGPAVFAKGVSNYLKRHAYGNAKTVDLWQALSEVSGNNITEMMYSWTREVGYPVISVIGESYDAEKLELTLELSQQRFLGAGDVKPGEDKVNWFIPIPVLTNVGDITVCLMTGKTGKITFPYTSGENSFYKLNAGVTGFYRVNYSDAYLSKLAKALLNDGPRFSTSDRIGISSDAFSMASSGLGSTAGALEVVKGYANEENQMVLSELDTRFTLLRRASYKNASAVSGLNALQRSIFSPKVEALGYDFSDSDEHLTVLKRTLAIKSAAEAEDECVIRELLSLYQKFAAGDFNAFNGNLRSIVFCTALKHSANPQTDFDIIFSRYHNGVTIDEKVSAVAALGATNDPNIVKYLLDNIIFDAEKIKPQDISIVMHSLAVRSPIRDEATELMWNFFTKNWVYLCEKVTPAIHGRTAKSTIISCIGEEAAARIDQFASGADCTSEEERKIRVKQFARVERPYLQALEAMRVFTKWYERDCENVCQWLSKNSFQ